MYGKSPNSIMSLILCGVGLSLLLVSIFACGVEGFTVKDDGLTAVMEPGDDMEPGDGLDTATKTDVSSDSSRIVIGSDVYGVVLWKYGTTVTIDFTSRTKGAPKKMVNIYRKAMKAWNKCMGGAVKIVEVKGNAMYDVTYQDTCADSSTAVASATLPHGYVSYGGKGTLCFTTRFARDYSSNRHKVTFLHEIGHVMGLRHTHDYKQFGDYDPKPDRYLYFKLEEDSIMSYNSYSPDRHFTKNDCLGTKRLYMKSRKASCIKLRDQKNKSQCVKFKTTSKI